jgi:hypothetical protein
MVTAGIVPFLRFTPNISRSHHFSAYVPLATDYLVPAGETTTSSISICVVKQHRVMAASRDDSAWLISFDVALTTWNMILADMML